MRTDAVFTRGEDENEQRVPAYFTSAVFDVDDSHQLNLDDIVADLDSKVEQTLEQSGKRLRARSHHEVHDSGDKIQTLGRRFLVSSHAPMAG